MILLRRLSHKNKIFFSSVIVILFVSVGIALVARWVLVSSLITRLEQRGMSIAQSVAEKSEKYVVDGNRTALTRLLFDSSRGGDRESLISYMFVLDRHGKVLSHTFAHGFPQSLAGINQVSAGETHGIEQVSFGKETAYDIAFPLEEGHTRIGAVHVGLSKRHIDEVVGRLRITFLGFISVIILIFFGVAHWLSRYITRPMGELIRRANEISRGNLEMEPTSGAEVKCWEICNCRKMDCPAHQHTGLSCWYVEGTGGSYGEADRRLFPEKLSRCKGCSVYKSHRGDEIEQLADAFNHMTASIKASRARLKESEQKYRSLFDSGPTPVFVLARNGFEILDANPAAAETYGYTREALIGRNFDELGSFEYGALGGVVSGEKVLADVCVLSLRVRHYRKGNRPFYVNVRACPGIYQGREVIILATNDLTEIMEKDAQLIQAGKMKSLGEMSAGIAHELNQPLNAIKMGNDFLSLMVDKGMEIPSEKLALVAREVSGQVDRASEIITRLREFARKADFSREKISINRPIENVVKIIGQQLSLQNIHLRFLPGKDIPFVLAHNNRLEQVIFNFLTNARDAIAQKRERSWMGAAGKIGIRSFFRKGQVVIAISDTGAGIPKDIREKMFEPFFTTKEVGKGMGLGLAIVYEIVSEHGGEIRVHSQTGIGTSFVVLLPPMES